MKPRPSPRTEDREESIARLDDRSRAFVASTAARRSDLELKGAAAFTVVTQALVELGVDVRILDLSARAIAEELDHSRIYLRVARAYAHGDVAPPRASRIEVPEYPSVGSDAERLLQIVGMCSINETMACSFLELCLEQATARLVRDGLRSVLSDEIRHARIGWALLGSAHVGDAERKLVSTWLLPMLRAQWGAWRQQIATLPDGQQVEHGCPSAKAIEEAGLRSILDLVLPGFARAGVDVAESVAWARACCRA